MEPDAPRPAKSKRRWYVRHLPTCVTLVTVGGALLAANVLDHFAFGGGCLHHWTESSSHGWPRLCVWRSVHSESVWNPVSSTMTEKVTSISYSFADVRSLLIDVTVALLILASTAVVCERIRKSWTGRPQFRLATLLWLTAVAAALLALMRIEQSYWLGFESNPIFWQPLWVRIPLLFGIGCTVYMVGQIGVWIVGRTVAKVARILKTQ